MEDKVFTKIGAREKLYGSGFVKNYLGSVAVLPAVSESELGDCYLLTDFQDVDHVNGHIYILKEREDTHERVWVDVDKLECGALDAPFMFWKRLTPDAIILHWRDPADHADATAYTQKATWDHDLIVRRHGRAPESIEDGEIVGSSSIPNQYKTGTIGFVDQIDGTDHDYYYRIFSVSKGGIVTPSETSQRTCWTWREVSDAIKLVDPTDDPSHPIPLYKNNMFKVGDRFQLPDNILFKDPSGQCIPIYAQIVSFDHSRVYNPSAQKVEIPPSITFMTVNVLGNMSFDNKETTYDLVADEVFKRHKKYFTKVTEGTFVPFTVDPSDIGTPIDPSLQLYGLHPSIRYFRDLDTIPVLDYDTKDAQTADKCGCSAWINSNLRQWLTADRILSDRETYPEDITVDQYLAKSAEGVYWAREATRTGELKWTAYKNGWSDAAKASHHLAPGSSESGAYIGTPPFRFGFNTPDGQEFLTLLADVRNLTITDQNVHRYQRNVATDDTQIDPDVPITYFNDVSDSKFWIPSFEEVYGRRPVKGINGPIDVTGLGSISEGEQFELFKLKKATFRKYIIGTAQVANWYLRTCDPTTVGRVYVVKADHPEEDPKDSTIEKHVTAHRNTAGTDVQVAGPVVCFTVV